MFTNTDNVCYFKFDNRSIYYSSTKANNRKCLWVREENNSQCADDIHLTLKCRKAIGKLYS